MIFVADAALDRADGDDRRRERDVELAGRNRLQAEDDLRRDDDRVDAEPRIGAVRLFAGDDDLERVDRRELRAGTVGSRPYLCP